MVKTMLPKCSGRTQGTTCRTPSTTPLQIHLNRPRPFGTNRLAYGPLEHIERCRRMGGWPMGMRFMGHTTCPHARAVANTDQGLCGASKVVKTATAGPCGVAARNVQSPAPWQPTAPYKHMAPPCTLATIATACDVTSITFYGADAPPASTTMLTPTLPCNRVHAGP